MDDAEVHHLVVRATDGDEAAWQQLWVEHLAVVEACAKRFNRVPEEILGKVHEQAQQSIHSIKDTSHFREWIFGIAKNICLMERRSQGRYRQYLSRFAEGVASLFQSESDVWRGVLSDHEEEFAKLACSIDAKDIAQLALSGLRTEERTILVMRSQENRTWQECAEALGISATAAKQRHYRALVKTKTILEKRGIRWP